MSILESACYIFVVLLLVDALAGKVMRHMVLAMHDQILRQAERKAEGEGYRVLAAVEVDNTLGIYWPPVLKALAEAEAPELPSAFHKAARCGLDVVYRVRYVVSPGGEIHAIAQAEIKA